MEHLVNFWELTCCFHHLVMIFSTYEVDQLVRRPSLVGLSLDEQEGDV